MAQQDRLREIIEEPAPERDPLLVQLQGQTIRLQMSSRNGRRFVWMVMNESGPLQNPLTHSDNFTNFNIGKQDIGRWLIALIEEHCPELYPIMVKEAKEDQKNDDSTRQHDSTGTY